MTLELLICTIDRGIDQVCDLVLPPASDISYVVSWQHSATVDERTVPLALRRDDIKVVHLEGRGLSRNRNNCLRHATADLCLICDDDCSYTLDNLRTVITTFEQNPTTDLAAFMMQCPGQPKPYPTEICSLAHTPAGYYPSSVELAFRLSAVRDRLQFNEHFGLGAPLFHCCEEEILVHDAMSLGLQCQFFPLVIVEHNHPTTDASRATTPGVLMGKGAYLYIGYRSKMFLYPWPMAWRLHRRHDASFTYGLRHIYRGLFYVLRHREVATAGIIKKR